MRPDWRMHQHIADTLAERRTTRLAGVDDCPTGLADALG